MKTSAGWTSPDAASASPPSLRVTSEATGWSAAAKNPSLAIFCKLPMISVGLIWGNAESQTWKKISFWRPVRDEKKIAQRGARTHDPEIKSLMLYRLS